MNEELKKYETLAYFLGSTIPKTFEIILFDTTTSDYPVVVHINNVGGTLKGTRRIIASAINNDVIRQQGKLVNRVLQSDNNKMLKSSLLFIKKDEEVVGVLCLNMQCDVYTKVHDVVTSLLSFNLDELDDIHDNSDNSSLNYQEPTLDTIAQVVHENIDDPKRATFDERQEVIFDLYDLGIFEIKGSVARTAEELCVSEQSIYRYISKIRKARG